MLDLLRALRSHRCFGRRLFAFVPAVFLADLLYKFHSFTLECAAFLATWLLFDLVAEGVGQFFRRGQGRDISSGRRAT